MNFEHDTIDGRKQLAVSKVGLEASSLCDQLDAFPLEAAEFILLFLIDHHRRCPYLGRDCEAGHLTLLQFYFQGSRLNLSVNFSDFSFDLGSAIKDG